MLFFLLAFSWLLLFSPSDGLWYDECFTLYHSQGSKEDIIKVSTWDANPPLFLMLTKLWLKWVGYSEFKLRLLSVLLGSLCVSLYATWVKKLLGNVYGIFLFVLLLFSEITIEYAHEARVYSLIFTLVFMSGILVLRLVNKPNLLVAILLGIVNTLIFFNHYIEGIIFLSQGLFVFTQFFSKSYDTKHKLKIAFLFFVSGLLFLYYLNKWRILFEALVAGGGNKIIPPPLLIDIPNVFYDLMNHNAVLASLVPLVVAAILFFLIFKTSLVREKDKPVIIYLLILTVVSYFTIYFVSFKAPMFSRRYLMFIVAPLFVLVVFALKYVVSGYWRWLLMLAFPVLLLSTNKFDTHKIMQIREAVAFVKQKSDSQTLFVVQSRDITSNFALYFDYSIFKKYWLIEEQLIAKNVVCLNDSNSFISKINLDRFNRVVVFQVFDKVNDPNKTVFAYLVKKLRFKGGVRRFRGVKILLFEAKLKSNRDKGNTKHQDLELLFYRNKIASDPAWLEHIQQKATEGKITLDEALENEAKWLISEDKRNLKALK